MSPLCRIAGVQRLEVYSPNHIAHDTAIIQAVATNLQAFGYEVKMYNEDALIRGEVSEKYIFNMVRSEEAIAKLKEIEQLGVVAVNSGFGIENCSRERMTSLLLQNGVPFPDSVVLQLDHSFPSHLSMPCWVKRSDHHAIFQDDVSYVSNSKELNRVLDYLLQRGIQRVVISNHLTGDLIKFYGVAGTNFFYWFYPYNNHSKFGLERINGVPQKFVFSIEELKKICSKAAAVLRLVVFGGDAIIAADGSIHLIDFNDWPSFAPCRVEGAKAITEAIIQRIERTEI